MPRRNDHDTPTETPMAKLVHQTPVMPWTPLNARLARYQADLDSIPPPPPIADRLRELHESSKVTQSGSWIVEDLLNQSIEARDRFHAVELMRERDLRLEAEKAAEVAEGRLAKQREWWADLAKQIIGPLVVAAILGVIATVWWVVKYVVRNG
jgi:hypothetical protein